MTISTSVRRAAIALVASALATSMVAVGAPADAVPSSSPAGHGATWLAKQIDRKGLVYNHQFKFNDYGLTADTVLGLDAIGGHKKVVRHARHALARHVRGYTGKNAERYAGPTAKLAVLAQQTGGGARHFGGVNLVRRLAHLVATDAPIAGRIEDRSSFGDFANTIGQVFAVRALLKAHNARGPLALRFLLRQQCKAGFLRLNFNSDKTARDQSCGKGDPADSDVTALTVVELSRIAHGHGRLEKAVSRATRWLKRHQKANGSFGGGPSTARANANSTGLAGWALLTERRCGAAREAARWLARLQVKGHLAGTPLAGERGAIAYDRATLRAARQDGIDKTTRDQWRRAGAQAAPALVALSRCGH
jgi:hypothetical protein